MEKENGTEAQIARDEAQLSTRERRVYREAISGLPHSESAKALGVSVKKMKAELTNIYFLLGVNTRAELLGRIIASGISGGAK